MSEFLTEKKLFQETFGTQPTKNPKKNLRLIHSCGLSILKLTNKRRTMTKKYYYDCPIQALYMHVNFGVKFPTELKFIADLSTDNFSENMTPDITKIYVKPESEHIFQPREGDIGICDKLLIPVKFDIKDWVPSKLIPVKFDIKDWVPSKMLKKETYYEIKETLFVKTVYRNGKHFFMPKEEN